MRRPICVATLGTSLTKGVYEGNPWQAHVAAGLTGRSSRQVIVYNMGVVAQDSSQRLTEMANGLYLPFRPEIIIVEFAMNDAYTPRAITTAQCKANAINIISQYKAQDSNCKAFVMTMNPCVAGSGPALDRPNLADYYVKYREIAAEDETIGLIDNEPDWGTPTLTEIPDGVHPTRVAERPIIVPNVVEALLPVVEALPG